MAAATRTEAAPLARERHEPIGPAGIAPEPGEAAREEAAAQERAELGVDEPRQLLTTAQTGGFRAKRLDMLGHEAIEHRRGGSHRAAHAGSLSPRLRPSGTPFPNRCAAQDHTITETAVESS